jgi:hypothetical protein
VKGDNEKKILLDSDVIRHFIKGGALLDLPKIYPDRLVLLKNVKDELCRSKSLDTIVHSFVSFCRIELRDFPNDNINVLKAFAELKKEGKGEGESAVMALARYSKDIIASSNLKDIAVYCSTHEIEYLTTMDILIQAKISGLYTESKCDEIIKAILDGGSRLPCNSISKYQSILNEKIKKTIEKEKSL